MTSVVRTTGREVGFLCSSHRRVATRVAAARFGARGTLAMVLLGVAPVSCFGDDGGPTESIVYTHLYDADAGDFSVSGGAGTYEPGSLLVYVSAGGTEPVEMVSIRTLEVTIHGESGTVTVECGETVDVEVLAVEDDEMQLAPFECPGIWDEDGQATTEADQVPSTFSASGWVLGVNRRKLRGTLAFDTPKAEELEIVFDATLETGG